MTEENEIETTGFWNSKFWRVFMIIVAVALIFVGPTYIPYLLSSVLGVDALVANIIGLVLLIVGIAVMVLLVRKKIFT